MSEVVPIGLARVGQVAEVEQVELFEVPQPLWRELWWDMPSFVHQDARPVQRITVNFMCYEDVQTFAKLLEIALTRNTDSIIFPKERIDAPSDWEYADET